MKNFELGWGRPSINDYNDILDIFSGTSISSNKTSSIPLAQYWKDTDKRLDFYKENLGIIGTSFKLYFEYPTASYKGPGKGNKASMTDLMIISDKEKIAIEAKFTEVNENYQSVKDWYSESKTENRLNVIKHWNSLLHNFVKDEINENSNVPYQFLHRAASACADNTNNAFVVYQIFYDSTTEKNLDNFKTKILDAKQKLKPNDNIQFFIHSIKIENTIEKTSDKKILKNVFQTLKSQETFKFGTEKIERL